MFETYSDLARSTLGAAPLNAVGFQGFSGDFDHPICNFAHDLHLDQWTIPDLKRLAIERPEFLVYVTEGDAPEHVNELLLGAGFRESFRLAVMAAAGQKSESNCTFQRASDVRERDAVATFMAEQFFQNMPRRIRNQIVASTVLAAPLELWSWQERQRIRAAFMVYENSKSVGLYNLCVGSAYRNRGIGGAIVQFLLQRSEQTNKVFTLQCHEKLTPWYSGFGIEPIGMLRAMSLSEDHLAIMI